MNLKTEGITEKLFSIDCKPHKHQEIKKLCDKVIYYCDTIGDIVTLGGINPLRMFNILEPYLKFNSKYIIVEFDKNVFDIGCNIIDNYGDDRIHYIFGNIHNIIDPIQNDVMVKKNVNNISFIDYDFCKTTNLLNHIDDISDDNIFNRSIKNLFGYKDVDILSDKLIINFTFSNRSGRLSKKKKALKDLWLTKLNNGYYFNGNLVTDTYRWYKYYVLNQLIVLGEKILGLSKKYSKMNLTFNSYRDSSPMLTVQLALE